MSDILIKGGRVIDPASAMDKKADVLIRGGRIARVGRIDKPAAKGAEVIDAAGKIVCPGLIDIHVHCRQPGHEEEETIATAVAAAVAGGFATIVAMPNTHPVMDNEAAVEYVIRLAEQAGLARVLPAGAITKGREGKELAEMGSMLSAGAVGFTDDGEGVASSNMMQRALQYAGMLDAPILQHCQDPDLGASGAMNAGAVSVRLGLPGVPAAGEEIMLQRDLSLLAGTGGRYHVQHVSTAGSVRMIRAAKARGLCVTAEATPHHLLLTEAACASYDPNYKMAPPLRTVEDVQALREAVANGTIDCLATDHAPHAAEEKELQFALAPNGIIGLECAVGLYVKALIQTGLMDWPALIARMTSGPGAVLKRHLGTLAAGGPGDVTIIDPEARYTVDIATWRSKSRNCPYHGWPLTARAVCTIVDGDVKFRL